MAIISNVDVKKTLPQFNPEQAKTALVKLFQTVMDTQDEPDVQQIYKRESIDQLTVDAGPVTFIANRYRNLIIQQNAPIKDNAFVKNLVSQVKTIAEQCIEDAKTDHPTFDLLQFHSAKIEPDLSAEMMALKFQSAFCKVASRHTKDNSSTIRPRYTCDVVNRSCSEIGKKAISTLWVNPNMEDKTPQGPTLNHGGGIFILDVSEGSLDEANTKVLLVVPKKPAYQAWKPAGGSGNDGELPLQTAKREVTEELGDAIGQAAENATKTFLISINDFKHNQRAMSQFHNFAAICPGLSSECPEIVLPENGELEKAKWISLAELKEYGSDQRLDGFRVRSGIYDSAKKAALQRGLVYEGDSKMWISKD